MGMPVKPSNLITAFRDSFEAFTPGEKWNVTTAPGDIIQLDGNALAASYLVISKDPWSANTETVIESTGRFKTPFETSLGLHLSQRTIGQEFAYEIVSDDALPDVPDIAVASISQSGTTLTIQAAAAHPLRPGMRFGVAGVSESRLNYPQLVCSVVNGNVIYATAGPGGVLPNITVGPFTAGTLYFRPAMGRARNGASCVFEGGSVTSASLYSRADSGDALPSGSAVAAHLATIGSTASVAPVVAINTYAFWPSNEYRLRLTAEEVNWLDVSIDTTAAIVSRLRRTQVVPSPDATYKLRFRATNTRSMSRPVACIVSVTKSGTSTATVVCDRPHGLTTSSYVVTNGVRDTTNFANITAQTVVTGVVDAVTFTVTWGTAATATSFGGFITLCSGGVATQSVPGTTVAQASASGGVLTLVGSGNWTGISTGDYVNAAGVTGAGGSLAVDGAYRVRDVVTTNLYLEPVGSTPTVADFTTVTCGGAIIKRSDLRISWVRVLDYERQRVEFAQRSSVDAYQSLSVAVATGNVALSAGSASIGYTGQYSPAPSGTADISSAAITSTTTTSAITNTIGLSQAVTVAVTAVSGTNPTLDIDVEESDDNGTNWVKIYSFPRIAGTGFFRSPKLPITGSRIRYVQTIGGTSPSFTRQVNRIISHDWAPALRQLIDRSISMTTLNSVTPSLDVRTCRNVQLQALVTAAGTAPVLQLEGSDDNGISWWPIGAALTATANSSSPSVLTVNNVHAGLIRASVSTAGAGVTYSHVLLKGF